MVNYIAQRYGSPEAAWAHEQQFNWYAAGGVTSAGWAMVGEHGRELVKMPGGATVYPAGQTAGMLAGGSGGAVTLEVAPGGDSAFEQFMVTAIRNWVRVKGGRGSSSVQQAFGQG
jgi:SLT domain-containing protein